MEPGRFGPGRDDEPTITEVVSRYLYRAGYQAEVAGDGHGALASAPGLTRPRGPGRAS